MKKWLIFKGKNRNDFVIVDADSFDEALEKARRIDKEYTAGRLI